MRAPVSVVIPCYNCADTLERAVSSLLQQSTQAAELILVDDASTDDTTRVIQRVRMLYGADRTRVIHRTRNAGPAAARNAAWDEATQTYIAWLDADDVWHPQKLEIQHGWMASNPAVLLTGHRSVVIDGGAELNALPSSWQAWRVKPWQLLLSNRFPTRSVMIRRSALFRFDPSKRRSEDYLLWLSVVLRGQEGWFLDVPLAASCKSEFGAAGLSADLWAMEKGELDTYRRVYDQGLISAVAFGAVSAWSFLKHLRRLIIVGMRSETHVP